MGPSIVRLLLCAPLVSALLAQQERTPLRPLQKQLPEVVLSGAAGSVPVADFGLGDGGVARRERRLRFHDTDGCVTPGGVHVACRAVGVKLTFPSGRQLLVAPDGALHKDLFRNENVHVEQPEPSRFTCVVVGGTSKREP